MKRIMSVKTEVSILSVCVILFVIISLIRFPYSSADLAEWKADGVLTISNEAYSIMDVKETANQSSVHYLLKQADEFSIVTFTRFPYWHRYDMSRVMPLSEDEQYEFSDFYKEGVISRTGEQLNFSEAPHISWRIFLLPFALLVSLLCICYTYKKQKRSS